MNCKYCGSNNLRVTNTVSDDKMVYRQRKCMLCDYVFVTEERAYTRKSVKGQKIFETLSELRRRQREL